MEAKPNFQLNIVLIADSGVGKTTVLARLRHGFKKGTPKNATLRCVIAM
jgi:GTPase SAR1 family protein